MTKHSISDAVDFVGEWFLPNTGGDQRISGILSWSSQRASLQLNSSFAPLSGVVYGNEFHSYPAVHGITTSGQFISVLDAQRGGANVHFGDVGMLQSERLVSSWLVIGAHVGPQTLYGEVRVRIPGLQIWIGLSGIRKTIVNKTDSSPASFIYQVEGLAEEIIDIPGLSAILGWGSGANCSGDLITDIAVKMSAYLRIQSAAPKDLDWYFQQMGKTTTLLSFLAGSPMASDQISAKVAKSGAEVEVLVALREAKYCQYRNGHEFFLLRNDMGVELGTVLSKWFAAYDTIAIPSQLALSILNSHDLWLHVEFLTLMQALEGFHRATMAGLYAAPEVCEDIRKALSNAIPQDISSDHKDALRARIKFVNEVSLRKRLDGLAERLPMLLRRKILGGDGTEPRNWIDTRNYYTHWDEDSRASVLVGVEMHQAHVRMRHLVRALYLDLVGIPHAALAKSLANASNESQYLIQLNNTADRERNPESQEGAMMRVSVRDPESPDESLS